MDALLATLAVLLSWAVVSVLLLGIGYMARTGLLRLLFGETADRPGVADLWIGFGVLLAYLLFWSLVLSVSWFAWIAPIVVGLAGAIRGARRLRGFSSGRPSYVVLALTGLGILWLANRSIQAALDYDLGLYHQGIVTYALQYPAIPGLGNLHDRLGAADAHLLFVAFLSHGPWAADGTHLADGLLASLLFVDLGSRFLLPGSTPRLSSFTNRLALLLVPATILVIGYRTDQRIASPNLDLAAFVLVVIGALYLSECVEHGFRPTAALTSTTAFATASATRPLYWFATVAAVGVIVLIVVRGRSATAGVLQAVTLACALPAVLVLGWMGRNAILTGYPLYPTGIGGLPVNWRMPASELRWASRRDYAWARHQGLTPDAVLGSWHWVHWWLPKHLKEFDFVAPLALLAGLLPAFLARSFRDPERRRRTAPMLAVVLPGIAVLVVWFLLAPDPRFVWAPLWLVPAGLLAWALPSTSRRPSVPLLLGAAIVAGALIKLATLYSLWLLPTAFGAWAVVAVAARLLHAERGQSMIGAAAAVSVALAAIGFVQHVSGSFSIVRSNDGGPGANLVTHVPTETFKTRSGLLIQHPGFHGDQCYAVLLCTPYTNSRANLRLRGQSLRDGFVMTAPPSP